MTYPAWQRLAEAVRTGAGVGPANRDAARQQIFSEGMAAFTAAAAAALAAGYDFGRHRRMLDLGGGIGSLLTAVLTAHPGLTGTVFELPRAAAIARRNLAAGPVADRAAVIEGDFFADPIPSGHDVILIANVLHGFRPEVNRVLLERVRAVAELGARLLLIDFWTDATHTRPVFAALMAGEFLTLVGGDVNSAEEAREWLDSSGWELLELRPLLGGRSLLVVEAV